MYKKKRLAKKKHRKSQLRVKAKIQESLLKAKPKKIVEPSVVDSTPEEETKYSKKTEVKKAPAKKTAVKKAPAKKKA